MGVVLSNSITIDQSAATRHRTQVRSGTEGPVLEILAQDQNDKEDSSNCWGQKEPSSTSVSLRVSLNSFERMHLEFYFRLAAEGILWGE